MTVRPIPSPDMIHVFSPNDQFGSSCFGMLSTYRGSFGRSSHLEEVNDISDRVWA